MHQLGKVDSASRSAIWSTRMSVRLHTHLGLGWFVQTVPPPECDITTGKKVSEVDFLY